MIWLPRLQISRASKADRGAPANGVVIARLVGRVLAVLRCPLHRDTATSRLWCSLPGRKLPASAGGCEVAIWIIVDEEVEGLGDHDILVLPHLQTKAEAERYATLRGMKTARTQQ